MSTLNINGTNYTVYGTFDLLNAYVNGLVGVAANAWNASDDDDKKGRCLNAATLLLNRQSYVDEAATFVLRDAIQAFRDAAYELATIGFVDPSVFSSETSGKNIKRVDAGGGVGVEFFNPTLGISGRFPQSVSELIGSYLAGATAQGVSGSFSSGTDGDATSKFSDDVDFTLLGVTR